MTMKAALLKSFGSPLVVETLPDPVLGTGEVVVDVVASSVLPYMGEVLSGERGYLLQLPLVPGVGAIGRVRAVGPDATRVTVGDWVFCDPTVRSRDDARTPDITLQGLSARGDGGLRLQRHFRHGPFAEQMLIPTENAIPIGPIDAADAGRWCALGPLLVPYGGFLAAELEAGETVLVSGATGYFGSGAVHVALAMGAGCVVAPGRNEKVLDDLVRRFGPRVRPVRLTGDEDEDGERMRRAAPGAIDCVLDLLPPGAGPTPVRTAAMTVREFGRVVLMGGVGMQGGEDLHLPYSWLMRNSVTVRGRWMYPAGAVARLIALIRSGLLDLTEYDVAEFALGEANEAVAHAAAEGGAFRATVLRPDQR
ncbi:alcohol dehydrogenase catalytic domain-containing protein [Streptomyces sp. NPDC050516]|uniref:alcohol dehydrogenase catalytic domain-containing protein n=1 Tax=Streptomyces sp. NPDC050516 TaxID=3365621 RepID=UPI003798362F